jgi:hypothetical protein
MDNQSHDQAGSYWQKEAERYVASKGGKPARPMIRWNLAKVTPHQVPAMLTCEAKCNGKTCYRVPELFVWHPHPQLPWEMEGEFVCVECYARSVSYLASQNIDLTEARHDKLPAWYDRWIKKKFVMVPAKLAGVA